MSGERLAAPAGAWIDRQAPLRMRFQGRDVGAFRGDTLASALLANGWDMVARSVKLHRPRGILGTGPEEPNALFEVGTGDSRTPDTRATLIEARAGLVATFPNAWPSLRFDLGALAGAVAPMLRAGFYYKTFMWPHWHWFEPAIRRFAGLGRVADRAGSGQVDSMSTTADVLVVGGGCAGLAAACAAAQSGHHVMLLEADPHLGGWLAEEPGRAELAAALAKQAGQLGVQILVRTAAIGFYDHGLVVAVTQGSPPESGDDAPPERLWRIRAQRTIVATGVMERPMLFPDNDRPGVMLAGAVSRYAYRYGVACGRRVLIATAGDAGYHTAHALRAAGIGVVAIVDRRESADIAAEPPADVPVFPGSAIIGLRGARRTRGVRIGGAVASAAQFDADVVASHGGFAPNAGLYVQAGGALRWCAVSAMPRPDPGLEGMAVVGACAGVFSPEDAIEHATRVGRGDLRAPAPLGGLGVLATDSRPDPRWLPRRCGKIFLDLQNDVLADDIAMAAREGYRSVEHVKRYTTSGMGTDQGRTSSVNQLVVLAHATGRTLADVGTTKLRPPERPVSLGLLVAGRQGSRLRPLRPLPARAFHAERGALFEDFAGWERPAAYLRQGESLEAAAMREVSVVRSGVGLFDASPLGKIEVCGPDAAAFLDLMYVGTISTLPVGGARYGVLLNENGIIVDDGIVTRLGNESFFVNTTSGGVERTALSFEEWLQTEYPFMRVAIVPVTAQWSNVTVSGPRAWDLLRLAQFPPELAPDAMKHMTYREFAWEDVPVRALRASFGGELGYELNVPASRGPALFERLWRDGQRLGIGVYGIEALMIMRTEKGFIHVGADTDGTTMPQDVGLARGLAKKKANFVGRRSLERPAGQDPLRLQLVGLRASDRRSPIRVGAHLCRDAPPSTTEGYVTSACVSPSLGEPIALALLRGGRDRLGDRLRAWFGDDAVSVEVVQPPFLDPEGVRLRG